MDTKYRSKGHCKFLLRYHLILVCKYRLKLMSASNISSDIKKLSEQIAKKHNVDIWYLESDKDHIHYMIEVEPNTNLANFVKTLKSYTTYHIWKKNIQITCENVSGKNVHFGLTVTSSRRLAKLVLTP